jgi:hypothetical protein
MRVPPLERPRRATAGLITLDRSLEAPAPDKGLAPQERGLSYVEVETCERVGNLARQGVYRTRFRTRMNDQIGNAVTGRMRAVALTERHHRRAEAVLRTG